MRNKNVYNLAMISIIAAMYAVLTLLLAPISFNVVQFRISEVLTILPLFTPLAIPGLTVGCLLANLIGMFMGQTMPWDLLFGTSATLIAGVITYYIGRTGVRPIRYILGPLPAVVSNGLIVGWELTLFFGGNMIINMAACAFGELVVCYVLGVPLIYMLEKNDLHKRLFRLN